MTFLMRHGAGIQGSSPVDLLYRTTKEMYTQVEVKSSNIQANRIIIVFQVFWEIET